MAHASAKAAATHSGRIKYADPRDLPSYPSSGLPTNGAAAGAAATLGWNNQKTIEPWRSEGPSSASGTAATLGWNNQKPIELWKPDKTSSASAAAALAKGKMSPQWEPSSTSAGHKAALLAVGSAGAAVKQQEPARRNQEGWGNSAATQAFHASRPVSQVPADLTGGGSAATQAFNSNQHQSLRQTESSSSPNATGERSLAAAKGAMSSARRPRSTSNPTSTQRNSMSSPTVSPNTHALSGAALAHRASVKAQPHNEAGAVPVTTMTRNMFTSHPPVKPETDEIDANERIHQTAVAMARKMYTQQQKMVDQAKEAHGDGMDTSTGNTYLNLQDAAYKQAQERLSKLHDEHQQNREIQEYYGNSSSLRRRFSMVNRLRRRSSSDGEMDDQARSEKIRKEMSIFSSKLSKVDQTKRDADREALMAAAQRNVKAQLQGMDQKVYNETGKVNPGLANDWELRARETAQARSEVRNEHKGMIDLGGGKFMNPDDVNAIAAQRMQPWLDEVNEKAEAERERLAVLKMEEDHRKEEEAKQKARDKETKEITKQLKDQEKQEAKEKRLQEKEEEKARKMEEKNAKAEQKRAAKEERRRSKHDSGIADVATGEEEAKHSEEQGTEPVSEQVAEHSVPDEHEQEPASQATDERPQPTVDTSIEPATTTEVTSTKTSPTSTSPKSKVKGWIRNRFSRGKSISEERKRGSFMGGASLKSGANGSTTSIENRPSSMRDVALAGKSQEEAPAAARVERQDSHGVSPVSSVEDLYGADNASPMEPPHPLRDSAVRTSSPARDSRFREEM